MANFCGSCGAAVSESNRFCQKCGLSTAASEKKGSNGARLPGRLHRFCISALLVWTAGWIGLTVTYINVVSDAAGNSAGAMIGLGLGLGMYGVFWFLPSVVLGIIAVASRPSPSVAWPRSTRIWTAALALTAFLFLQTLHLRPGSSNNDMHSTGHSRSGSLHEVRYLVDAGEPEYTIIYPSKANLTYRNETGGSEQTTVTIPWELKMQCPSGFISYIAAQKGEEPWDHVPRTDKSGLWHNRAIHVAVYVDGHIMQQAKSSSPYGVASASAQVASLR